MQYYINKIKKELNDLAVLKKERALEGMSESFQHVLLLLPTLIHYHHYQLPGYTQGLTTYGISLYQPEDHLLAMAKNEFVITDDLSNDITPSISALYSMGSTGSIGQSIDSDLDVWVCIEHPLTEHERQLLRRKCHLIEQWADGLNVKLTLFIVDVDRFRDKHHECLIGENCGSAQHMLLLEEFYRTANVIAGKPLIWFIIPPTFILNGTQYSSYDACIGALIEAKVIKKEEWLDFGSLMDLSAEEYFGASLWQLYKSIDYPFKAVLKTLLLEAYSWEYPTNKTLAYEMKALIHTDALDYSYLDSYYMLLEKITRYLVTTQDKPRLDLIRSCFYLKVNEPLSIPVKQPSWRRKVLTKLVKSWQWDKECYTKLDQCRNWKIEQVREVNDILLQAMMTGYRNLLNFGRRNNLNSLISPQDVAILTRKLYATYEILPGKVTIINSNLADDLSECDLTFIHVKNDRINRAGWYLYNQKPSFSSIVGNQYLEYSPSLVKLVAWSYFNGLIYDKTTLFYRDGLDYDNSKIIQLVSDLQDYFPKSVPPVTEDALYGPCEIRHLAIMINLEGDPTTRLYADNYNQNSYNTNVLNYGDKETNLVQSIDLLYRNSWNEIRVLHFMGQLCVLDALKTLLNRMHKDADLPDSIEIFCYSKYLQNEIKEQMQDLMDRCVNLRLSATKNNLRQFKPFRINGSSWYLFFERFGVSVHQFDNTIDFYGAVSNNKVQGRALNILDDSNELPKEIDSVACEGIIQFFFEDTLSGFDLYILNEYNQVEIYRNCNGNKQSMIRDVNNFYVLSDDRFTFATSSSVNFNLPQFYEIIYNAIGEREIIPFN